MCRALAQAACPVALWTGDLVAAEGFVTTLADVASRHALGGWIVRARCFEGALLISQGQLTRGANIIEGTVPRMSAAGSVAEVPAFLAVLAHGRGLARQWDRVLAAINEAIARSVNTGERWCAAELLRIKGEILLRPGAEQAPDAANCFAQGAVTAREQGVLGWELRIGLSTCRMRMKQGLGDDGRRELALIYGRFTEGLGTADLIAARQLLDARDDAG
jgi:predicted ATPase